MDGIFLFGKGSLRKLNHYKNILDTYCRVIGTKVNKNKSCMRFNGIDLDFERHMAQVFYMPIMSLLDHE